MNTNVSVRMSQDERQFLESAASSARVSLSEYIRSRSVRSAERDILERREVVIPANQWDHLESWLNAPAQPIKEVQELFERTPVWER